MLSGSKIAYFIGTIYVPHELTKEVGDGHLAQCKSRKAISQVHFDGLAEHLLIAEIISANYLHTIPKDLVGNFNVLNVKRSTGLRHRLTC